MSRSCVTLALAVSVVSTAFTDTASAQQAASTDRASEPAARWVFRPPTPFVVRAGTHHADRVIVKFAEGIAVRERAGRLVALGNAADLDAVRALLARDATRIERLFTRTEADLDAERNRLLPNVPAGEPPLADLNNYYRAHTSGLEATQRLVDGLLASAVIETAYAEFVPHLIGDIPPMTPLFENTQNYLGPTPDGYAYRTVESIVGARGQGLAMAQLEGDWHFDHEDIDGLVVANLIGTSPGSSYRSWRNHGTACVGLMAAGRNGYGVRGMGSDIDQLYVSSLANGAANMINLVAGTLQAGDVMSSSFAWSTGSFDAPVDWTQASYDAVRSASMAGIHYAFGAGNSGNDLGDQNLYGARYAPGAVSSGGFIIGGSDGASLINNGFNFGARIDANGWGSQVTTTGYGSLFDPGDVRQRYTDSFGGTSAAGPGVAGVIATLVGAVKEQDDRVLTPAEVHADLAATGTPVPNIANRPDLVALFARYGLPDGLLVGQDGTPGTSVVVDVDGNAGETFGLIASTGRGRTGVGANRDLLLDQNLLLTLTLAQFPASGATSITIPVPNDPTLSGTDLYLQALRVRGGALNLTNSVLAMVR